MSLQRHDVASSLNATPNLLLAGVPRAGTTALAHVLGRHQEIHVGPSKEPHHLAYGGRVSGFAGPGDDVTVNRQLVLNQSDYLNLYRPGSGLAYRCDASVSTLYQWVESRARHHLLASDTKVVICLREPLARAHSAHLYLTGRGFETASFVDGLAQEDNRVGSDWHHMWHYRRCSQYSSQLAALAEDVGPGRVHIVITEELRRDQSAVIARLFQWLELETSPEVLTPVGPTNRGGVGRSRSARALLGGLSRMPLAQKAARRLVPFEKRHRLRSKLLVQPELSPGLVEELGPQFRPDRDAVSELLGRVPYGWQ